MKLATTLTLSLMIVTGCAASGGHTRTDVLASHGALAELSTGIDALEAKGGTLLAPDGFAELCELREEAINAALEGDGEQATSIARQALGQLEIVKTDALTARAELSEVLETRWLAMTAGAALLFEDEFADVDADLRDASRKNEQKDVEITREAVPGLIERYAALELRALERGVMAAAEAALDRADEAGADEAAPRTFSEAEARLEIVESILEADRTRTNEAEIEARAAMRIANRASAIAELVQRFETQDYTLEDIVLWHQHELERINDPLGGRLPFEVSDAEAVEVLTDSVESLIAALSDMRGVLAENRRRITEIEGDNEKQREEQNRKISALLDAHRQQLEDLHDKLREIRKASKAEQKKLEQQAADQLASVTEAYEQQLAAQATSQAVVARERELAERRFETVRSLFGTDKVNVSRIGDNVLIRAFGFDFPRGETHIGAGNFGLLSKIVAAIETFPNARVKITGHTDSRGSEDKNLDLSRERADSVAQFLITVGEVEPARVEYEGLGESKPVAPNETKEGRAQNRRIDVMLINE